MNMVKPFVKWVGGKGSLLSQLNNFYPMQLCDGKIKKYVEPFVGGGAVLIDILQRYDIEEAYAFDINVDLINCYNVIKNNVEELIVELKKIEQEFVLLEQEERKELFGKIRKEYNSYKLKPQEINIKKAKEFIFLNRTCFNGLYRVNQNGDFNVPCGTYKNPRICDAENLRNLSKLIQNVVFECGDYKSSEKYITENTFVYFDPPYRPLSLTSAFTSYTKEGFNDDNQIELGAYYRKLNDKDAILMLSNSNPKNTNPSDHFFDDVYNGFKINEVFAKRNINSKGDKRGAISELLITNYEENLKCAQKDTIMKVANLN